MAKNNDIETVYETVASFIEEDAMPYAEDGIAHLEEVLSMLEEDEVEIGRRDKKYLKDWAIHLQREVSDALDTINEL